MLAVTAIGGRLTLPVTAIVDRGVIGVVSHDSAVSTRAASSIDVTLTSTWTRACGGHDVLGRSRTRHGRRHGGAGARVGERNDVEHLTGSLDEQR